MKNLSSDSTSSNRRPMPLHLVQLTDGTARRVAVVDEPNLRCLDAVSSVYSLAQQCLRVSRSLEESVHSITAAETLAYDDVLQLLDGERNLQQCRWAASLANQDLSADWFRAAPHQHCWRFRSPSRS